MKTILSVVGARPNFMKLAPIHMALQRRGDHLRHVLCHTGQHYDESLSEIFFDELLLPKPHHSLGIGSGSHAEQTGRIMIAFESVLLAERPDLVVVLGDVNSTIACGLAAVKCGVPVAHVEAGLRSFDRTMPEEINRQLTDALSTLLFVPERSGLQNLKREGIPDGNVFFVGNVMIDTLLHVLPRVDEARILGSMGVSRGDYVLATFHRPDNVDTAGRLEEIVRCLNAVAEMRPVLFPAHPRTLYSLELHGLRSALAEGVQLMKPLGYAEFVALLKNAALAVTDSGGVQEESTFLGVQCVTFRTTTERPVTVEIGTNHLVGVDGRKAADVALGILGGKSKQGTIPELWDGHAAERIVEFVCQHLRV